MSLPEITVPRETLAAFCRRHGIRRLAVFGSALRDDFRADSDIDMLVEFEPGARVGLGFFAIERELAEIVGRKVDLNTAGFLGKAFREQVIEEARTLYDARP